jgi:hypothetical protein
MTRLLNILIVISLRSVSAKCTVRVAARNYYENVFENGTTLCPGHPTDRLLTFAQVEILWVHASLCNWVGDRRRAWRMLAHDPSHPWPQLTSNFKFFVRRPSTPSRLSVVVGHGHSKLAVHHHKPHVVSRIPNSGTRPSTTHRARRFSPTHLNRGFSLTKLEGQADPCPHPVRYHN